MRLQQDAELFGDSDKVVLTTKVSEYTLT